MCGLFKVSLFHEDKLLTTKKIFAKTLRGALCRASRMIEECEFKKDITYVGVHSLEHVDKAMRRFYDDGMPISPWLTFEEPLDV